MPQYRRLTALPVALGALLLAACGSDDSAGDVTSPAGSSPAATTTSSGEFNDADVAFAQGMIPHHEQAVEMAGYALSPEAGAGPEIVALATEVRSAQDPEIAEMTAWLQSWGQPVDMPGMEDHEGMDDMEHQMAGMMSAEDMAELQSLSGAEFDTAWATMMIEHHEGAISQARAVLADGSNPDVLALADRIIAAQQAEIDQMRQLLGE